MKMTIGKNILANAIGRVWHAIMSFAFVPIFVKLLGEESYGIVTFFAVMQTVLNLMGVGLQKTIRREFTNTGEDIESINLHKYKLLRSCELIYLIVCLIIFFLCYYGSDFIANKWLNYDTLDSKTVAYSIILMGLSIGLQLLANLYIGGVFGLDLQVLANVMQTAWATIKNACVVPILYLTEGNILYFYIWMVLCDFLYVVVLRITLLQKIPTGITKKWQFRDLRILINIWKYAGGLFLISIGSILNTQLDKIILSKTLTVIDCGAYNSVFHLGSFTAFIPSIIGTAIFSNISSLLFQNKNDDAEKIFIPMNRLAVICVSVMASFMALFSYEIILVWTGSETYANITKFAAPLVILGYMLNAFQQVPYDYLLAKGITRLNQIALFFSIPYVCIVTYYLTTRYGVLGASIAWFTQLLIVTTFYLLAFYKICFNKSGLKWLIVENYGIFILSFIPAVCLRLLVNHINFQPVFIIGLALIFSALTFSVLLLSIEKNTIIGLIQKRRGL